MYIKVEGRLVIFVVIGVSYGAGFLDRGGDARRGIRSRHGSAFAGDREGTEGGRVYGAEEAVVQNVDVRMQVCSGEIEFDCCQGESLCCRDLGRFRQLEKCVTGGDAQRLALAAQRTQMGGKRGPTDAAERPRQTQPSGVAQRRACGGRLGGVKERTGRRDR